MTDKQAELRRAKRRALFLLLGAAALYLAAVFVPGLPLRDALRVVGEAALVGGLADWFAVHALFHRIPTPLPFITRHTAVIPRNKERIADNLALFVKERFLDAESLAGLIRRHDPAAHLGSWLAQPANVEKLGGFLAEAFEFLLALVEEERVQQALRDAFRTAMRNVDLSQSTGAVLRTLTSGQRHQELLDQAIGKTIEVLERPQTRAWLAARIVRWLKEEHPLKEKALPSTWLGDKGSEVIAEELGRVLAQVQGERGHELRRHFDAAVERLIVRLQADPELQRRGDEIKAYLLEDDTLAAYVGGLWGTLRRWIQEDIHRPDSALKRRIAASGGWLAARLAGDASLRASLNAHMEDAARRMAPDFAAFLSAHIRDTIRGWETRELVEQIELNVGRDLQAIRVNGTLVGGLIGLLLYLVSQLPAAAG